MFHSLTSICFSAPMFSILTWTFTLFSCPVLLIWAFMTGSLLSVEFSIRLFVQCPLAECYTSILQTDRNNFQLKVHYARRPLTIKRSVTEKLPFRTRGPHVSSRRVSGTIVRALRRINPAIHQSLGIIKPTNGENSWKRCQIESDQQERYLDWWQEQVLWRNWKEL